MGKHRGGKKSSKKHRTHRHNSSSPRHSSKHHKSHRHSKNRERSTEREYIRRESSSTDERSRRFGDTSSRDRTSTRHSDNHRQDDSPNGQGTSYQNNSHDLNVYRQEDGRRRFCETPPEDRSPARHHECRKSDYHDKSHDKKSKNASRHHSSEKKHEKCDRKRRHNERDTSNQGRSSKRHHSQERQEVNDTSSVDKIIPYGFEESDVKHRISESTRLHLNIPYVKQVTYCNLAYEKTEEPKYIYIRGEDGMRQARNFIDDASIKGAQLNYEWSIKNSPEEEEWPETSFYYWTGHKHGRFFSSPDCAAPIQEMEKKFDVSIEKVTDEPDLSKISGGYFREVKEQLDDLCHEYYLSHLFEEIKVRTDLVKKMGEQGCDLAMLEDATDIVTDLTNGPGLIQTLTLFGYRDNVDHAIDLIDDIAKRVDPRGEDIRIYEMKLSPREISNLMGEKNDEDEKLLKLIENTADVICYLNPNVLNGHQHLMFQGTETNVSNAATLVFCAVTQGAVEITASEAREYLTEVRLDY
ncbi:hypothetical protein CRE_22446 [Caenorhabditis remanei]|uniref:Uncharacterized protein n=1 Tax=Caenorhabditis remanei TaxID=31234 RepID=E3ME73_CAERE|nr:hypothetical protein CRE_22446 [Caenorhabditis remanei]